MVWEIQNDIVYQYYGDLFSDLVIRDPCFVQNRHLVSRIHLLKKMVIALVLRYDIMSESDSIPLIPNFSVWQTITKGQCSDMWAEDDDPGWLEIGLNLDITRQDPYSMDDMATDEQCMFLFPWCLGLLLVQAAIGRFVVNPNAISERRIRYAIDKIRRRRVPDSERRPLLDDLRGKVGGGKVANLLERLIWSRDPDILKQKSEMVVHKYNRELLSHALRVLDHPRVQPGSSLDEKIRRQVLHETMCHEAVEEEA